MAGNELVDVERGAHRRAGVLQRARDAHVRRVRHREVDSVPVRGDDFDAVAHGGRVGAGW